MNTEASPIKVMLVDDEDGFTTLTKMNLERSGKFVVAVENDPVNAAERARHLLPHIIVLDLVMPGMDGGDVAAQIRATPELSNVKIIILTALVSQEEDEASTIPIGGKNFRSLSKPVKIERLEAAICEELGIA